MPTAQVAFGHENRVHRNSELSYGTRFAPFRKIRLTRSLAPQMQSRCNANCVLRENNVSQTKLVTKVSC
jgi:hypothetical protein